MFQLEQALKAWEKIVGPQALITDQQTLKDAEKATFRTEQHIPAVLRPADRRQVKACLKTAQRYKVAVYPVSKGKNWGLGSRVPIQDHCVLMELDRLDRIVDYDEKLAYITVEPGVTFRQAAAFLREQNSSLFLSVIGGHPESSLIGNALERGDGIGPYGDRLAHACAMEIVLPNGELIQTGFSRFSDDKISKISRWGVGPHLDGLFSQSNLGIVTEMTFWLMAKPNYFQSFLFSLKDMNALKPALEKIRILQSQGIFQSNSLAIWNAHKMIASEQQYPWDSTAGRTPLALEQLKALKSPWGKSEWIGVGALYSASKKHGRADRRIIKEMMGEYLDRIIFINKGKAQFMRWFNRPLSWVTGADMSDVVKTLYTQSVFLGYPTERSTRSTYWRKKSAVPQNMDPDRDGCGVIWLCPVVPFDGAHITAAIELITDTAKGHGFEPHIAFIFPSERCTYMFPSIVYDREVAGEDERAMACHDEIFNALLVKGYYPYRLGVQSMLNFPSSNYAHDQIIGNIKGLLDPSNILSPGRYVFNSTNRKIDTGKNHNRIQVAAG